MTRDDSLDAATFEALLDVHGADLGRWPESQREPAQALLAHSELARAAHARAQRLAGLLDAVPEVLPSAALMARIAALPVRHPHQSWGARWWPFGNPLAPLFAWSAAALLGLFVGNGVLDSVSPLDGSASSEMRSDGSDVAAPISTPAEVRTADLGQTDDLGDLADLVLGTSWGLEDE
jgi:hypothetical protein